MNKQVVLAYQNNLFGLFSSSDDQEPNPETLLSRSIVMEFYTEMAKLKSLGVLHKVNKTPYCNVGVLYLYACH